MCTALCYSIDGTEKSNKDKEQHDVPGIYSREK